MQKIFYRMALRFKTPSSEGKSVDFKLHKDEILEAINEFNQKFRSWSKRLILCELSNHLNLMLVIEKEKEKVTTREIRSFTAYLYHEKNWKIYSRETSKLFEGVQFTKISLRAAREEIDHICSNDIYRPQKKDVEEIKEYLQHAMEEGNNSHEKNPLTDDMYVDELTDDQAQAIFRYIIETKDLGFNHLKKKDTLSKIKNILLEWI